MAETDILNPQTGYWAQINDNPNPNYSTARSTPSNAVLSRTRMGSWYQRDNANAGYSFTMNFMNRPWSTMLRLKQFYEIGKTGYFTYIDYDGGGRHHVGRFTTPPKSVQMSNGKYNCQGLVFEEVPQARMLLYPSDFADWGKTINVVDDFLQPAVATLGNWARPGDTAPPNQRTLLNVTPAVGDFAQIQYAGFGFQIYSPLYAQAGLFNIYLDDILIVASMNAFNGTYGALTGYSSSAMNGTLSPPTVSVPTAGSFLISMPEVPLDVHRLKFVALNQPGYPAISNAQGQIIVPAGGVQVVFAAVQVIP